MDKEVFRNISSIIERDNKSTTYKFALLRGTIDVIQDNSPFIKHNGDLVEIPLGLLIEKWLIYYYPIISSSSSIPQINGKTNLAFHNQFLTIIDYFQKNGGLSGFYNYLRRRGIPDEITVEFRKLIKKIANTITSMPMKHLGWSLSGTHYSIYKHYPIKQKKSTSYIDSAYLISNFGFFTIPSDYYDAFYLLGSFINGQDSILFKWAEFSVNASGKNLSIEKVLNEVLKPPVTKRDSDDSINLYENILKTKGSVTCVWTGSDIDVFEVDHVIPFCIWKNNDLWNLLPSTKSINKNKLDKIPSPGLISARKYTIISYWQFVKEYLPDRFKKEVQLALLGDASFDNWEEQAIIKLQESCDYLITNRGYTEWIPK